MFTKLSEIDKLFGNVNLLRNRLNSFYSDFDRSFDSSYQRVLATSLPRTNLYEDNDHFEIRAVVPGLSKEELKVKIQGNYLEISGNRKTDAPDGYRIHKTEREAISFSRSFTLPAEVDATRAEASLKDGVLYMTLPKSEAAKPKRITIS